MKSCLFTEIPDRTLLLPTQQEQTQEASPLHVVLRVFPGSAKHACFTLSMPEMPIQLYHSFSDLLCFGFIISPLAFCLCV